MTPVHMGVRNLCSAESRPTNLAFYWLGRFDAITVTGVWR